MPKLIWSDGAKLDIRRLHQFLAGVNPDAANRAVEAVRDGAKTLKQFPNAGRVVEGLDLQYRDWLVPFGGSGYVLRYHFDGQQVLILLVRHQRELPW